MCPNTYALKHTFIIFTHQKQTLIDIGIGIECALSHPSTHALALTHIIHAARATKLNIVVLLEVVLSYC